MGRHALLEARDIPAVTPQSSAPGRDADPGSAVRTVSEIIAQFRREQGLADATALQSSDHDTFDDVDSASVDLSTDRHDDLVALRLVEPLPATVGDPDPDDRADEQDQDRDDLPPSGGPGELSAVETPEQAQARARREAAWHTALRPGGEPPHRRRAPRGGGASAVIASLTAELAESHPGLLEGTPHRRRAQANASTPARRIAPAGDARTLRPVRVTAGLRGAALRVPTLAAGWRVPARTPLVLAGAVAVTVVVTDQTGLLPASSAAGFDATAVTTAKDNATTVADTRAASSAAAASEGVRQARSRVSRLDRTPIAPATTSNATPAGDGTTAIAPAPPPDSVMKPGQTIPGDFVRPSPTGVYNSCFCSRWGTFHEGIDFAAPLGSPILAAAAGVVVDAGPASGFGNWVVIKTENGDLNIYGHMRYFYVKAGDTITAGQEIAVVGAEGQSTGPHLHFGVKVGSTNGVDGTYIDPVGWLVARGVDVGTYNQNG